MRRPPDRFGWVASFPCALRRSNRGNGCRDLNSPSWMRWNSSLRDGATATKWLATELASFWRHYDVERTAKQTLVEQLSAIDERLKTTSAAREAVATELQNVNSRLAEVQGRAAAFDSLSVEHHRLVADHRQLVKVKASSKNRSNSLQLNKLRLHLPSKHWKASARRWLRNVNILTNRIPSSAMAPPSIPRK